MTSEARFARLVSALRNEPGVTHAEPALGRRAFGANALKRDGRIFAMLSDDRLVVKLPASRVTTLVDSGDGTRYEAGKGRPMKEWLVLDPASRLPWHALAVEAMEFVG